MVWIAVPVAAYSAIALLLFLLQDRLLFIGAGWGRGEALPRVAGVEVEWLVRPNGERFRVAIAEARGESGGRARGVIVCFLGNGEDLRSGVHRAALWAEYGLYSVVVEYPGYGDSEGSPGSEEFYAAADVAAGFARARARELGVPLFAAGSSLGTFSAVHLAAGGELAGVVLKSPPTSILEAGRARYPWLPVSLLLRHDFDNLAHAGEVRCRVLVLHGDRDGIVPQAMGREVAAAFAGDTTFVSAEGYGHNDLPCDADGPFGDEIRAFLFGS